MVSDSVYPGVLFQFGLGFARSAVGKQRARQVPLHVPSSVGATFRSPVQITGFFLSKSLMYASKCVFHVFFSSNVLRHTIRYSVDSVRHQNSVYAP